MNPDIWGPGIWTTLHSITLTYPEAPTHKDIQEHRNFLHSVGKVLPCPGCRIEYNKWIARNPPALHSRDVFVDWMIDLHNDINKRLNKKVRSKEYVINLYKNMYSPSILSLFSLNNNWSNPVNIAVLLILIIIGVIIYLYKTKKLKSLISSM